MYRILSLDGGGSWAILQLLTLQEKYGDVNGHIILRDFDLVVANSGGSIVLAALCENWKLSKAVGLFEDKENRERIFRKNPIKKMFFPVDYFHRFGLGLGPKYSAEEKRKAFGELFPECERRTMSQLPDFISHPDLNIVVCTYDALNNRAKFFRSYVDPGKDADIVKLTDAIHGSSNAPIQYFDFPAKITAKKADVTYELWDGALGGFNNPVLVGIIEAMKSGIPRNEISVISLGTGNVIMSQKEKKEYSEIKETAQKERGRKFNIKSLKKQFAFFQKSVLQQAKTILYEPPEWANYVAYMFLFSEGAEFDKKRFIRLSPMIHIDKNNDDPKTLDLLHRLYILDMDLTEKEDIDLLKLCFEYWRDGKIKNQPLIYSMKRDNEMIFKKGAEYFRDGLEDWEV